MRSLISKILVAIELEDSTNLAPDLSKSIKSASELSKKLEILHNDFRKICPIIASLNTSFYDKKFKEFKCNCRSAIFSHQNDIMVAPSLWNRIKAYISKLGSS